MPANVSPALLPSCGLRRSECLRQVNSILDLAKATGLLALRAPANAYVIITEYNGRTQGFLVSAVEHIVNLIWEAIHPPHG